MSEQRVPTGREYERSEPWGFEYPVAFSALPRRAIEFKHGRAPMLVPVSG